ncbi:putative calcineurin-like phosphoesterase domain, ApaH type, metallo-dependent phosphatase, partial [Tanacetum coccineum]
MGLPSYHRYRCCQFLLMKLEFFYVEVLEDMKTQGISHLVLHGILDLGDGKLIRVFLQAIILELLIVMEVLDMEGNNTLHLFGLLSDSGVHSRLDQLQLLLNGASERGAKKIRVYVLTDGRDVLDSLSIGFPETLEAELASLRNKGIDAQLPKRWWVFCLDLALHNDIDYYQFKFFLEVIQEKVKENDYVIVMTNEPNWILDWYWDEVTRKNVSHLIRDYLKGRCKLRMAGDLHHYMQQILYMLLLQCWCFYLKSLEKNMLSDSPKTA